MKGRRVPAKSGSLCIACIQLGLRKLSVVWSSEMSTIQLGVALSIEVNERTVGTFRIVAQKLSIITELD